jgi:capsid portal protein
MTTGTSYGDLVELAHLSRDKVAAAYGIPPPVMGILDNAIKANVEELREQ